MHVADTSNIAHTCHDTRPRIVRQVFFEYAAGHTMKTKDEQRSFSEAERIAIYLCQDALCQLCLQEVKPEREAQVRWREYEAVHVLPHTHGGRTAVENGHALYRYHNHTRASSFKFAF